MYQRVSGDQLKHQSGGMETVLLVEDNELVRPLICRMLKIHNYKVLEAANGEEALKIIKSFKDTIHILITDILMPGIDGVELSKKVRDVRPDTKMLFISGYTADSIPRNDITNSDIPFLQKPFTSIGLASKVKEIMN